MNRLIHYHRILCVAIAIHLIGAWFSLGHYKADEYSQLLELAAHKLGWGESSLLSQHHNAFRAGFQPFIAWLTVKVLAVINITNPFVAAFLLRLLSAALSVYATLAFYREYGKNLKNDNHRLLTLAAMLLLWPLLFFHLRFSSEAWMTSFVLWALAALHRHQNGGDWKDGLLAGTLFGLAFLSRYQTGLMLAPLALWLFAVGNKKIGAIMAGGLFVLAAGLAMDAWLYNKIEVSWWNYLLFHLKHDSAQGGAWWIYIERAIALLPPVSLLTPFIVVGFWLLFPKHVLTAVTVLYVLFHLWIENRQARFLLPLLPLLPFMFALLWQRLADTDKLRDRGKKILGAIVRISFYVNLPLLLYVAFTPAAREVYVMQHCIQPFAENKKTALYMPEYNAVLEINMAFYNPNNVEFIPIGHSEPPTTEQDKAVLYALRKKSESGLPQEERLNYRLLCRGLPEWVTKININDWVSRSSIWRVWEVRR